MTEHMEVDVRDRLESVKENLAILIKQTRDGQAVYPLVPGTDPSTRLTQTAQQVSDACTKLVVLLSHSPPPSLDDCGVVCRKVEEASLMLVAASSSMSPQNGRTLREEVRGYVLTVLCDLESLFSTLMREGCTSVSHLQRTGSVWKSCEAVTKLSKENRSAVLKAFISQLHLLKDACSEVLELQSSNGVTCYDLDGLDDDVTGLTNALEGAGLGEDAGGWTSEESIIVSPCIKLIQLTAEVTECSSRLVVTRGDVTNEQCITELDEGCDLVRLLSPAVDDLACELSAPIVMETCRSLGTKLGGTLLHFTQTLSGHHYCRSERWTRDKYTVTIKQALEQFSKS